MGNSQNRDKRRGLQRDNSKKNFVKRDGAIRSDDDATVLRDNYGDADATAQSDSRTAAPLISSNLPRESSKYAQYSDSSAASEAAQRMLSNDNDQHNRPIDSAPSVIEEWSDQLGAASASPIHIRFINLVDFERWGCIPTQPDCGGITVDAAQLLPMRDDVLFVYVSHNWLVRDDGMVYPDDEDNSKHQLIVRGIEEIMHVLAPGLRHCYLWIDSGCRTMGADYKQLPEIIKLSDCIFTPPSD